MAAVALDTAARFPDDRTAEEWIVIRAAAPDQEKAYGDGARKNARMRLHLQFEQAIAPYAASTHVDDYWIKLLDGKDAEAKAVLTEMKAKGLPAP